MILDILRYPDKRLHLQGALISKFNDPQLDALVANMAHTMYVGNGIGLAATQVNVQKQLFVLDLGKYDEDGEWQQTGEADEDIIHADSSTHNLDANALLRAIYRNDASDSVPNLAVGLHAIINPQIVAHVGNVESTEGCLSVPDVVEQVMRFAQITLKYQTIHGATHTCECSGLLAICVQHEIDHLHGKVFVEYLSTLKQNFIRKKLKKSATHAS